MEDAEVSSSQNQGKIYPSQITAVEHLEKSGCEQVVHVQWKD